MSDEPCGFFNPAFIGLDGNRLVVELSSRHKWALLRGITSLT